MTSQHETRRVRVQKPVDIAQALSLLAASDGTGKIVAGGQSLGPMLNLRLAQPTLLVDVRTLERLKEVKLTEDALVLGACTTHAAIEDGLVPDVARGFMQRVARDIAYRAVRNRGTLGGSLCHADPAADWVSAMMLLSALVIIEGRAGTREVDAEHFVTGAFSTALGEDEVLAAIRIPKLSRAARWGWYKFRAQAGRVRRGAGRCACRPGPACSPRGDRRATHGRRMSWPTRVPSPTSPRCARRSTLPASATIRMNNRFTTPRSNGRWLSSSA